MIIRTLAYVCDMCKTEVALSKVNILNLPDGWIAEQKLYSYYSPDKEKHICPLCIEKREIRETFK